MGNRQDHAPQESGIPGVPLLPQELLDPDLPTRSVSQSSLSRRAANRASRGTPFRVLRVWAGRSFEDLVKAVLDLNHLSIRDAARLTGLPYTRFSSTELGRRAKRETIEKIAAGLHLPLDVLCVRNNMLPPGGEDDVEFQDRVVYLWRKVQRRRRRDRGA